MNDDAIIETLSTTIDAFMDEVDIDNWETEDLALAILRSLKENGQVK